MTASNASLSVILMVDQQRQRSANALRSLLNQKIIDELDILLVDFAGAEPLPGSDHKAVRLFNEALPQSLGKARAHYVAKARASIVAFVEDHVTVGDSWAEAVIRAHEVKVAGVGGEVLNGNYDQGISRVSWLFSYGLWMPPVERGTARLLPSNNASYKRDILLSYGEVLPALLEIDILLQQRLREDGHTLLLDPSVKFSHCNEVTVRSLCRAYYWYNRCLGNARIYMGAWALGKRLAYIALSPIIPFVRTLKLAWFFAHHRPHKLGTVILHIHWLLLANICAVIGQISGIMPGTRIGIASARFLDFELNEPRGACGSTASA